MRKKIFIDTMTCGTCKKRVETVLKEINGVTLEEVSLNDNYALVDTDVEDSILKEVIEGIGFLVTEIQNL